MSSYDTEGREHDARTWGSYTVLDDKSSHYKVKQINLLTGQRLSHQRHQYRAEHWFMIFGSPTAILDGVTHEMSEGASLDIGIGQAHRCENHGALEMEFIEIQTGAYVGDDDIVRLEDDHGSA